METQQQQQQKTKHSSITNTITGSSSSGSSSSSSRRAGRLLPRLAVLLPLAAALAAATVAVSAAQQPFVYEGCSQEQYTFGSDYETSLTSALAVLQKQAQEATYGNISVASAAFALYQCRADLDGDACSACLRAATSQIAAACGRSRGARIQLDACFLRYDPFSFFGLPDDGFVHSVCGSALDPSPSFASHRADVLSRLTASDFINGQGFRVTNAGDSRSGYVHALAQCEGDLALPDCAGCIDAAVQRLRDACLSAVSGSVYLAKCYARYDQSPLYRDPPYDRDHHHHSDNDDAGKTVAIIIGLLAGIALIVVFLTFLKQACARGAVGGGKGKG